MGPLVTQSDEIAWGATVIAGTRVPVDTLFEYLERGKPSTTSSSSSARSAVMAPPPSAPRWLAEVGAH